MSFVRCRLAPLALALTACASEAPQPAPPPVDPAPAALSTALRTIDPAGLLERTRVLASDEFEGRAPGSAGEDKTVGWLSAQFQELGLAPGNPHGSYVQDVPLVGIAGSPEVKITAGGKKVAMRNRDDFVAATSRVLPRVEVRDSELVFVGYGVQAPEYGWDDYKGLDVRGKTLVMLINDPAIPDPQNPGRLDDAMFKGRAMTYYGRWTYKYEIASKLGAAAVLIVHETEPAAYPWEVVRNSWSGEQFGLAPADRNLARVPVQGWITRDKAQEIFRAAGQDFDALKTRALRRDFAPVPLRARASFTVENQLRTVSSRNVVALLPGSDPQLADELLIYTAHWDHFGRDPKLAGDQIFNGAVDNATGTAGLLEIAQAFAALPVKPKRSILFLAVTAEEQGLLGSQYYAEHPLYPLDQTVATINQDAHGTWGATRDLSIVGAGQNSLEDTLARVALSYGRRTTPDEQPEKGSYFRSDQFNFARHGVPSLYTKSGVDVIGRPAGYGAAQRARYTADDYHKVSDEVRADWDVSGIVADLRVLAEVGYDVANDPLRPTWKDGSEFKALRPQ